MGARPIRQRTILLLLSAAALVACEPDVRSGASPPSGPRVVSLSPLASRFVLALDAAQLLVGVDAASGGLPGLAALPQVDLGGAPALEPDLVLLAELPGPGHPAVARLEERGARLVEFAPHDLEDVLALVRELGGELVGRERASRFERELSRPLAAIGGEAGAMPRPRVAAVVSLDPLVIAGGHSFETDLIEIAGGHSVTHPGEEPRLAIGADRWRDLAPDLILVVGPAALPREAEPAVRNSLPPGVEVGLFPLDDAFWLDAPTEPARRLRALIEPLSRRMQAGAAAPRANE